MISTPQSAIFGFWGLDTIEQLLLNHSQLIMKCTFTNLQCKNKGLPKFKLSADIYIYKLSADIYIYIKYIRHKGYQKNICKYDGKRGKKFNKKEKMF